MKTIALIAPSDLPIPNYRGGAIETLATTFLEENEKNPTYLIHVFAYYNHECDLKKSHYKYSVFHFFHRTLLSRIIDFISKVAFRASGYVLKLPPYMTLAFNSWAKRNVADRIIVDGNYSQLFCLFGRNKAILYLHVLPLKIHHQRIEHILNELAGIFVISDYVKNTMAARMPKLDKSKVHVVFNCIEINDFSFSPLCRQKKRDLFNIPPTDYVVLFCGRVCEGKGVEDLVKAFLRMNSNNSWLLIVGSPWFQGVKEDSFYKHLKAIASKNTHIFFLGFVDNKELYQFYSSADVFVSPSKCHEAAGLVNIEAASNGLPIITSSDGGIPEYVKNLANVFTIDETDRVESLCQYLKQAQNVKRSAGAGEEIMKRFSSGVYFNNLRKYIGGGSDNESGSN